MTSRNSKDEYREKASRFVTALFHCQYEEADSLLHPQASWWIIGLGEISRDEVRRLSIKAEGGSTVVGIDILSTVVENDKVSIEISGDMLLKDGRRYMNSYHHLIEFKDGLIFRVKEYFDTAYVRAMFGNTFYDSSPPVSTITV